MISIGYYDQRERKKQQGQAAAFYSSVRRQQQISCLHAENQQQVSVLGMLR